MRVKDLDMIYELETKSYDFPWTKEILRDCILYNYDSYSVYFGDVLVGYIISKISYPETHILNLTVSSQFRNNGIGGSLVQLIINDVFYSYVALGIPLVRPFRRCGWKGTVLGYKYISSWFLTLMLTDSLAQLLSLM